MHRVEDVPVQRDSSKGEDAGIHGQIDDKVHHFAHKCSKHPLVHGVDGGLERNAKQDEAEISETQVQDEHVGRLGIHLAIAQQDSDNQAISHRAKHKNKSKYWRDDRWLNSPVQGELNLLWCIHRFCLSANPAAHLLTHSHTH